MRLCWSPRCRGRTMVLAVNALPTLAEPIPAGKRSA